MKKKERKMSIQKLEMDLASIEHLMLDIHVRMVLLESQVNYPRS